MAITRFSATSLLLGRISTLAGMAVGVALGFTTGAAAGPVTVATNGYHTCAVTAGGGVRCWGRNDQGQLGDGTTISRSHPAPVTGLTAPVTAVVTGGFHTCALTAAGGVKCWGSNNSGELGDGSQTPRSTPVDVTGLTSGVIAIAAGVYHTCAVTGPGGVKCWGENYEGELGTGAVSGPQLTPVDVSGLTSGALWSIASYERHTCVTVRGGIVKCWGVNSYGQLGDGTTINRAAPVTVVGLSNPTTVTVGRLHTCASESRATVKCWGNNGSGQLGDGTSTNRLVPVPISGLGTGVNGLAAGAAHTCAISAAGGLTCWGSNGSGQLGDGTYTSRFTPTAATHLGGAVATAVTVGASHTCAVVNGWRVVCWGANNEGQIGAGVPRALVPTTVAGLTGGAAAVAAATGDHACAIVGGGVKCWGLNTAGQLGDGTTINRMAPVDVAGLTGVVRVAVGSAHTCALTGTGVVKCWGDNYFGQLGDGTTTARMTPVDVVGLGSGVTAVAAGSYYTCAVTAAHGLRCWGANGSGQLGDNTTTVRLTPVDVLGLTSGVLAVTAGVFHTCALTDAGGVKCWGYNSSGEVGDGSTTDRHTPVNVSGLTGGVAAVAAGGEHTCALTAAGGVKCWGYNGWGQVGDNTTTSRNTPVDVSGLSSGTTVLSAGYTHTCAAMGAGAIKCWGSNGTGEIGDGITAWPGWRTVPTTVRGLTGATSLAAADGFSCAITGGGAASCWGRNNVGQIGDGTGVDGVTPVFVPGFGTAMDFGDDGQADIILRNRVTGEIGFWLLNGVSVRQEVHISGPQDPNWQIVAAGDFNADGKSDLVWRNRVTGENVIWFMNGTAYVRYTRVRDVPDPNWQIVGAADFDLDGKPDLVWRNQVTGDDIIWLMDGPNYRTYVKLQTVPDRNWTIIAADDFDGNNQPEIVWFNASTRQIILWHMNGTAFAGYEAVTYVNPGWQPIGSGDTDGDDRADLLWHNPATGENMVWRMDGAQHLGSVFPPTLDDPEWEVMWVTGVIRPGPGDFNLDGCADIVWNNTSTGADRIWYMNGATLMWARFASANWVDLNWRLTGVGDVNGDQKPDLVWRHAVTGELRIWLMNGATYVSNLAVTTLDVKWEVVAVGDFNGDGKADLVFRHADTGENVIWFMNGATRVGYTRFTNIADTTWKIVGAGDFNGDGQSDLVWRNSVSGQNIIWLMNGATFSSYVVLQTVADGNWKIASVGDFDGDGKPDVMWRNTSNGQNIIWFMNGTSLSSYSYIQSEPDLNWTVGKAR